MYTSPAKVAEMLYSLSTLIVTASFTCLFDSRNGSRYLNENILDSFTVDEKLLIAREDEGREGFRFSCVEFEANFHSRK